MNMNSQSKSVVDIEVRPLHVDFTGAIFHPWYLSWFVDGRWELFKSNGVDVTGQGAGGWRVGEKSFPVTFIVGEVLCRIYARSKIGDLLLLETCVAEVKQKKVVFKHRLYSKDNNELVAEGYGILVCCDIATLKSREMPPEVGDFFFQIQCIKK